MGLSQYIQSVRDRRDAEQQKAWNSVMPALEMRYNMMQKELAEKNVMDEAQRDYDFISSKFEGTTYLDKATELVEGGDVREGLSYLQEIDKRMPTVFETLETGEKVEYTPSDGELQKMLDMNIRKKTIPAPSEDKETSQKDIGAKYNLDSTIAGITGAVEKQEAVDKRRELEGLGLTPENQWTAFSNWYQAKYPAQEDQTVTDVSKGYQDEAEDLTSNYGYSQELLINTFEGEELGYGIVSQIHKYEAEKQKLEGYLQRVRTENFRYFNGKLEPESIGGRREESAKLLEKEIGAFNEKLKKYEYLKTPEQIELGKIKSERALYTSKTAEKKTIAGAEAGFISNWFGARKVSYYYKGKKIKEEEYEKKTSELDSQINEFDSTSDWNQYKRKK